MCCFFFFPPCFWAKPSCAQGLYLVRSLGDILCCVQETRQYQIRPGPPTCKACASAHGVISLAPKQVISWLPLWGFGRLLYIPKLCLYCLFLRDSTGPGREGGGYLYLVPFLGWGRWRVGLWRGCLGRMGLLQFHTHRSECTVPALWWEPLDTLTCTHLHTMSLSLQKQLYFWHIQGL